MFRSNRAINRHNLYKTLKSQENLQLEIPSLVRSHLNVLYVLLFLNWWTETCSKLKDITVLCLNIYLICISITICTDELWINTRYIWITRPKPVIRRRRVECLIMSSMSHSVSGQEYELCEIELFQHCISPSCCVDRGMVVHGETCSRWCFKHQYAHQRSFYKRCFIKYSRINFVANWTV